MDDLISRQAAIDAMAELQGRASTKAELKGISKAWKKIKKLPPAQPEPSQVARDIARIVENEQDMRVIAQPEIIYCKDCRKHNKKVGFDENFHTVWKEDACPLASWRGKAQGHEFDNQFCAYGERRTE